MSGIPEIPEGFTIVERHDGIVQRMGKSAGIESNWYYDALDQEGKECFGFIFLKIHSQRLKEALLCSPAPW